VSLVSPVFKCSKPDYVVFAGSPSIVEIANFTSGQVALAVVGVCLVGLSIARGCVSCIFMTRQCLMNQLA
jgi:hypothetical protein